MSRTNNTVLTGGISAVRSVRSSRAAHRGYGWRGRHIEERSAAEEKGCNRHEWEVPRGLFHCQLGRILSWKDWFSYSREEEMLSDRKGERQKRKCLCWYRVAYSLNILTGTTADSIQFPAGSRYYHVVIIDSILFLSFYVLLLGRLEPTPCSS